jgi:cytosine/uracil/thiamine/allantoin permease
MANKLMNEINKEAYIVVGLIIALALVAYDKFNPTTTFGITLSRLGVIIGVILLATWIYRKRR